MSATWDGRSDLPTVVAAIGPGYAVDRSSLRDSKEKMRTGERSTTAGCTAVSNENVVIGSPVEQTRLELLRSPEADPHTEPGRPVKRTSGTRAVDFEH